MGIKPTHDNMYHHLYDASEYDAGGFSIFKQLSVVYDVRDTEGPDMDKRTTYIMKDINGALYRVVHVYNSWGDDQFEIDGPVAEYQVIHDEYLTEEEANRFGSRVIV